MAPFALALSVPWDNLDWTQAEKGTPNMAIDLDSSVWALRIDLARPGTGDYSWSVGLNFHTTEGEETTCGDLRIENRTIFMDFGKGEVSEPLLEATTFEWRYDGETLSFHEVFGTRSTEYGRWTDLPTWISSAETLELTVNPESVATSIVPSMWLYQVRDSSAPEPGIVSFILLGGGCIIGASSPVSVEG